MTVRLLKRFRRAVVADNKLAENPSGPENQALELQVDKGGDAHREIVYAKFPGFSLSKTGNFSLSFAFQTAASEPGEDAADPAAAASLPANHPAIGGGSPSAASASTSGPNGNIVEFHVDPSAPNQVRVALIKAGEPVGGKTLKEGDSFQTPWMGMTIYVGSIVAGASPVAKATPVDPVPGADLPPSAVYLKPAGGGDGFWLGQGDVCEFAVGGRKLAAVFANETMELPFELKLEKFTKVDYPGTETAMSFESDVALSRDGGKTKISMNEPLKEAGFTLYQASYLLSPGAPPTSVLSVNRDPGRPIKYAGSLILALGIVTFTLMRSRLARPKKGSKA